jgi:hypothetical protein
MGHAMTKKELNNVLADHKKWLESNGRKGCCANLRHSDLRHADLSCADLRHADLSCAYLSCADLHRATLFHAKLFGADLRSANLYEADLRHANLSCANLYDADLRHADLSYTDLRSADLDFSCWPIWCGSLSPRIDAQLAAQLMYHAMRAMQSCGDDADVAAVLANADNIRLANRFHRAEECGLIGAQEHIKRTISRQSHREEQPKWRN